MYEKTSLLFALYVIEFLVFLLVVKEKKSKVKIKIDHQIISLK